MTSRARSSAARRAKGPPEGHAHAVRGDQAEAGERRRQMCLRMHRGTVRPVADDAPHARIELAEALVETLRLDALIGDHGVAPAPPELDRDVTARDRTDV